VSRALYLHQPARESRLKKIDWEKMKAAFIIVMFLITVLLLLGIIGLAVLWFRGSKVIVLPGLGILITTPLLLASFIALEVVVLLALFIFKTR
jgi:hypothetical protein